MGSLGGLLAVVLLSAAPTVTNLEEAKQAANAAAEEWLLLMDAGNYDAAWDEVSPLMKTYVEREQWRLTVQGNFAATGKVVTRSFEARRYNEIVAGAPDGSYVMIRYKTTFEKKVGTSEQVAMALGANGKWRVSGYSVNWKSEPARGAGTPAP